MQRFAVVANSLPLDILNLMRSGTLEGNALYDVTPGVLKGHPPDVLVISALDSRLPSLTAKHACKSVVVVSRVPHHTDSDWPVFYTNLCMATLLAGDSFVQQQLAAYQVPSKSWILLDAVSPTDPVLVHAHTANMDIKFYNCNANNTYWRHFAGMLREHFPMGRVVDAPDAKTIGIAFQPIGSSLALYLQNRLRFLSVGFDPLTSAYLDCRQNHRVNLMYEHLTQVPGGSANAPMREAMKTYLDELLTVVEHSHGKEHLVAFQSNAHLLDRIFHSLNRLG